MKRRTVWINGEAVLFKRSTDAPSWEPGTYVKLDAGCPGWHWVKDGCGIQSYVPTRRIHARTDTYAPNPPRNP